MEDMLIDENYVKKLARALEDEKTVNVIALDLRGICSWTDFFLIGTVNSDAQRQGVMKNIKPILDERDISVSIKNNIMADEEWALFDCGEFIIHLMSQDTREFYNLEDLYYHGKVVYSSKSS